MSLETPVPRVRSARLALVREVGPEVAVLLLLGYLYAASARPMGLVNSPVSLALMVPLVGGAMLYRRRPGLGMLVLILGGLLHVWLGVMPMPADLAFAIGGFGAAAYGRPITRALAAFLLPIGAWIGLFLLTTTFHEELLQIVATVRADPALWAQALGKIAPALVVSAIVSLAPWLLGLAFRAVRQSRSADLRRAAAEEDRRAAVTASAQARELARLQTEQTRLARDVHDVVGHSLTVILAQAESAQYLPDDDVAAIKATMVNVADTARTALGDVRRVLSGESASGTTLPGLDQLIAGVQEAGTPVQGRVVGTPRPLPTELAAVAYRVLQEMLTNAVRHGDPRVPIQVEQHWEGELRLEVVNAVENTVTAPITAGGMTRVPGTGLDGMRARLDAVGGRLDVRQRREQAGRHTFTATAWVPVRDPYPAGGGGST